MSENKQPTDASNAPAPEAAPVPRIVIDDFLKVNLVTARVLDAAPHPGADRLLVLKLDIGQGADGPPRQICAGIRGHYEPSQLVGKTIVLVENLQPRKLRGEMSEGMLLAVTDGDAVRLLTVDAPVSPGLRVG